MLCCAVSRRDACADTRKAIVIKIVDECRCSLPAFPGGPRGNFLWCCNTPTPRLGINRHIDLGKVAFTEVGACKAFPPD
ncbi:hypothetical protein OEZ86_013781 [Tetradesmus obliquus]|uniref:Pherophorin domain-containing protein n=1 Tax=Tetradesmus obliquus TaxID=3088 RepID=A0ABY8UIC3_TETOB|nr:hypothetical protein OEZ85_005986 [Tetradesmus obliquus]WIA40424.1 hypothetical protein OEZ86_013781 [Tetradesmus obliquus]